MCWLHLELDESSEKLFTHSGSSRSICSSGSRVTRGSLLADRLYPCIIKSLYRTSQHGAALTYRRSGHSLETRVSTQSLHASLSLVSSNSLLSADSSGALQHTGTIHCCSRSEMIMAVLFSLPCGTYSGTSGSSGTNGTSGTSWALKMIK